MPTRSNLDKKKRLKVIIADDVVEMRRSTRLMLTLVPTVEVVAIAHNGREAVELTQKHKPDIALMDVQMPEMDGLQAIRLMMERHPPLVCVVVSAQRDSETVRHAIAAGARDYIIKPFTSDTLVTTMDRVIKKVEENKLRFPQPEEEKVNKVKENRRAQVLRVATQYRQARRRDAKAMAVYEYLAKDPNCDKQWLTTLAMLYVIRREWKKLQSLSGRLSNLK